MAGEVVELRGLDLARSQKLTKQRAVGKLAHVHGVLDGRPGASQDRRISRARDGGDIQVEGWGHAAVESQLFLAQLVTACQRARIQKRQVKGLLELPGVLAVEQHPRDVGFDEAGLALPTQVLHQGGC